MAISRSLMNRQLRADGGIMQVAPREKFGLGSSIKKFVRKIIPNEVSEIAVKAAPFVAPFNPLLAAAMSGIGSFDQTGRIGSSLKSGALTYGLGQGARYLGGAGFQDPSLSAFTPSGFKGGFSSPFGSDTGIGKMLSESAANKGQVLNQELKGIKGVGEPQNIEGFLTQDAAKNVGLESERLADLAAQTQDQYLGNVTSGSGSAMDSFNIIKSFETPVADKGKAALDLLKRGSKTLFYDSEGKLDRAAVIGAATAAVSYAEALALAKDAGVELTEEEYNQAQADEKREEYAGYLQNFFGGKKDGGRIGFNDGSDPGDIVLASDSDSELIKAGKFSRVVRVLMDEGFDFAEAVKEAMRQGYNQGGRIGFESGANKMIKTQLLEEIMPDTDTDQMITIMTEDGPITIPKSLYESMPQMFMDTTTSVFGDAGRGRRIPEEFRADGGRIGFKFGTKPEEAEIGIMSIDVEAGDDEDEEDMMMAGGITFNSAEKSFLFKRLGGAGGSDRSYTMPSLYRILNNPNKYPEDARILKAIVEINLPGGQKDGGRIGYKGGANRVSELLILRDNLLANGEDVSDIDAEIFQLTGKTFRSVGGISDIPTGKMRKNNAGVVERDYRDEGGFVPVGIKERADDVPAMLSKNEFVMTADAVRGIGNGSVEEGSKKLYNTMKKAEQVGKA